MDKEELQKNIALYYSKLSPKLQEIFSGMKWLETLKQLAEKYSLNQQQVETLGTETTLILLGIIHLNEYKKSLRDELKLPKEITEKILAEIDELILKNILPELSDAFYENTKSTKEQQEGGEGLDPRFINLPEDVQDAIMASDYNSKLYNIAQENKLNIEQMGSLGDALVNVILGTLHPDKFEETIRKNLELTGEKAKTIVNAVNEKILKDIKKKIISINKEPEEVATPQTTKLKIPTMIMPQKEEGAHPVLAQKLGGSFKVEATTTEHTLENLSKTKELPSGTSATEIPKAPKVYPPHQDPYRLSPDE